MVSQDRLLGSQNDSVGQLRSHRARRLLRARQGVWVYFALLLFEGALRKWFLPFLATPLLVVRDPVALWVLYQVLRLRLFPKTPYLIGMTFVGVVGLVLALLVGHGDLFVALFGARMFLIHWPFMFAVGAVFQREDVLQMGRVTLAIAIPMAILTGIQFYSPQSAWVNLGVGGDEAGAGFSGALGYFRPPGTFSFTIGNSLFFSFVAAYLLYFWIDLRAIPKALLVGASVALLAAIPLSISRSLLFQVVISAAFLGIAAARRPRYLGRVIGSGVILTGLLIALRGAPSFQTATAAFSARFESASEYEGGLQGTLGDRFLGGLMSALQTSGDQPLWGYGMGLGTNAGSAILAGKRQYLLSEGEWGRLVGEMGAILGLSTIFLRVLFSCNFLLKSYKRLLVGDVLPWMLMSFGFLFVAQGQWAQPTSLGFSTLIGGLVLASFRRGPNDNHAQA